MTATLLALPQLEIPWSRPEHALVVGKDILELLSTSMYVDPMSMYREYVQNSADSVDLARAAGILEADGVVEIKIEAAERKIFIRDNGAGLSKTDFLDQLTALGGSKKRGTGARGFRGVGRLAGLAFAQELIFRSRQHGENTVHELKWNARDVRSMLRSLDPQDLRDIVGNSIEAREIPGRLWPDRFFEIELRGVIRHRDDRLLNEDQVAQYLAQVAPVPFHPDFRFGDQITSLLETHGIAVGAINIEVVGRGKIYRPHRNSTPFGKSTTAFQELTTIHTPGRDAHTAAVTWVLHSDYRGSLPSASLVDGWRFRVGDIQIGNNDLLVSLFPEVRFNSWCVAETHVIDTRILPNGRRDNFEQNSFYIDLLNHLAPHARDIAQRCRAMSVERNVLRQIESQLSQCDQRLRVLRKGALAERSAIKLAKQVERDLNQVQRLSNRSVITPDRQITYHRRIKNLRQALLRSRQRSQDRSALMAFTPVQRSVLTEVFAAIYGTHQNLLSSQTLIDKILTRLNRRLPERSR